MATKEGKVNLDYLNLYQEVPLFCALKASAFFRKKAHEKTGRVLIVNTCLVGEFAASIPAISDYIARINGLTVDLMVSPPLQSLAERIRGVRRVYVARSLYGRRNEEGNRDGQKFDAYDLVFVMRISKDAFRLIRGISFGSVRTGLREYSGYAIHLWSSLLNRKLPKQWIELNFKMLDGQVRQVPFGDIFQFRDRDYDDVARLEELQTTERKIIVHTGAGWVMKKWDNDKWIELLRKLRNLGDMRFIFVGSEEDVDDYTAISSKLDFPAYSLINKINLLQLLLVLRQSDYFIGTDSGPRNMAHLADTRSLAILGPGPHFYMPWSAKDAVIDKSRGCGLFQMFVSAKKSFINQITADEVYDVFKTRIWNS